MSFHPQNRQDSEPWALVLDDSTNHIMTTQSPKLPFFLLNQGGVVFAWLVNQSSLWLDVLESMNVISDLKILGLEWPSPPLGTLTWYFEGFNLWNTSASESCCHFSPVLCWLLLQLRKSIHIVFLLDLTLFRVRGASNISLNCWKVNSHSPV